MSGDTYLRSVFLAKTTGEKPGFFGFAAKDPEWENLVEQIQKAYFQKVEKVILDAFTSRLGRPPKEEDIVNRGRKLIYPDGTIEYCFDDEVFLRIVPPVVNISS